MSTLANGGTATLLPPEPGKPRRQEERWVLGDLLDFEWYLEQDEKARLEGREALLEQRDHAAFRSFSPAGDRPEDTPPLRRRLFRFWLEKMRVGEARRDLLPGGLWQLFSVHVGTAVIIVGALLGFGVGSGALYYGSSRLLADHTPEPVNLFLFLGVCVLPQVVLALFGAVFFAGALSGLRGRMPAGYAMLGALLRPLLRRVSQWGIERVDPAERDRLRSAVGIITGRLRSHRPALWWPLAVTAQRFGMAYSGALTAAVFLFITFSDRSCGWQSSARWVTPERVYSLAKGMALPWRAWWGEQVGYPDLPQVRLSQVILSRVGEDAEGARSGALKSWLNFLLLSTVAYGVVPRGLLYLVSRRAAARATGRPEFQDLRSDRLFERLTAPQAGWQPQAEDNAEPIASPPPVREPTPSAGGSRILPPRSCVLLTSPEVLAQAPLEQVADLLSAKRGWQVSSSHLAGGTAAQDRETVAYLRTLQWSDGVPRVFLLQEAFLPPVRGVLNFLGEVRQAVGPRGRIVLGLIGQPAPDTFFTPAGPKDCEIWTDRVQALGDANLAIENWF